MSEILQHATAGTMESSDAYVEIEPERKRLWKSGWNRSSYNNLARTSNSRSKPFYCVTA